MAHPSKVTAGQRPTEPVYDSYGRLSWHPTTRELEKIETQHADNEVTIKRARGQLGESLDDGLSAWKKDVRRPGFEKLLERAAQGISQGIAVWHVDRLFRQPRDLEKLIDLADHGFRVISSHGERDLSDPDDRYILRIEVAHAARSSDDTSRRTKRRNVEYRKRGRPTGGRPGFGFTRKDRSWTPGDGQAEEDRPVIGGQQIEEERDAIRQAVTSLLLRSDDQTSIARKWNTAGFLTPEGNPWAPNSIRDTLLRPILAGRIEFDGDLISRLEGEPVVTEKAWLRIRAMIEGRRRGRPPSEKYLGSGVILCGECRKPLNGQITTAVVAGQCRGRYYCNAQRGGCGRVTIDMRKSDSELRAFAIARLSDSRHAQAISLARAQNSERLSELGVEIEQIEEIQSALSLKLGKRQMKLKDFETSHAELQKDLEILEKERDALTGSTPEGPVVAMSSADVARQWDAASTSECRAMLRDAIGADEIHVMPSKGGKRVFDPNRIALHGNR